METEIKKLAELEYNEIITLGLIENNEDLKSIFTDEVKLPFSTLYRLSKDNQLSEETKDMLSIIFNKLILTKKEYIAEYLRLAETKGVSITEMEKAIESVSQETQSVKKAKTLPIKKEVNLPRRYGKLAIEADIKKQNGKASETQLAAIATNNLKNIYVNLNNRLIKDMFLKDKILTDEDCREIKSAIRIVENKLRKILKKK